MIYSDHNPLTYITESSTKSAKLMRWLLSLQSYNVTFKYKEGRKNVVADCLSRLDSATEWRWRKFLQISCVYSVVNNYCDVLLFLYVLCRIWWYWRDVLVLRRNSREWQLGDGISWCEKQWTVQFWSYDLISEVSTNGVFILTSRLCHVWLCDVASPIPS